MFAKKYDSGLTVLVERMPALRSVSVGIMVGAGSLFETPEINGISHFTEHVQFKGTEKRSAVDISNDFDEAGATFNAYTGRESTCYYFKSIDEKTEQCFDILSDLFLHSVFDKTELDRERKVIVEEINMSMDEPDSVCSDVLYRTAFSGPEGLTVLGPKENVLRFSKQDVLDYKAGCYTPANTCIGFVGNITEEQAVALVEKYMPEYVNAPASSRPESQKESFNAASGEYIKDFEQSELAIAFPTFPMKDERHVTLCMLDYVLGTGMGSRLFRRLREEMGLVYNVYSMTAGSSKNGLLNIYVNVNVTNIDKSIAAIKEEVDKLATGGVTAAELQKAKTQLKAGTIFGKENPMSYLLVILRRLVICDEVYDLNKIISDIENVTLDGVNALAREVLSQRAAFGYAGKKPPAPLPELYYGK